jgi:hypothetical protein
MDDNKKGRYDDFNIGDNHFQGLVPVESLKASVRYPTLFF